ncbi:hypothetical protein [Ferrimicrobium acidiphilum]|jgi:hypothetical protein|uniref:Uncharacterized protein n=1 Tax=Ferrimicrobium acidiphilum DSM 19497 TaxID=1121877 RepID=A0A0D8FQN0_9ACTN|nr:hypothetical protein [Ferrimicrobium acidiphilum]KJE75583.1 hypothetical protein FEAC_26650 [Ferrimicrobium acidiphilum DSM 19497]MCL5053548.1 hypothetical protein [Gammaproteobacteria bacterium]
MGATTGFDDLGGAGFERLFQFLVLGRRMPVAAGMAALRDENANASRHLFGFGSLSMTDSYL